MAFGKVARDAERTAGLNAFVHGFWSISAV